MTAPKTKELALSRYQLDWLLTFLKEVENSSVSIETATITISTLLGQETPFKMAWRTDEDGDQLPHILMRVPA